MAMISTAINNYSSSSRRFYELEKRVGHVLGEGCVSKAVLGVAWSTYIETGVAAVLITSALTTITPIWIYNQPRFSVSTILTNTHTYRHTHNVNAIRPHASAIYKSINMSVSLICQYLPRVVHPNESILVFVPRRTNSTSAAAAAHPPSGCPSINWSIIEIFLDWDIIMICKATPPASRTYRPLHQDAIGRVTNSNVDSRHRRAVQRGTL